MKKNILNKISTLSVVAAVAMLVALSNPFANVELNQASGYGYGYGYGYEGSTPNKDSLTLKDDCRVNGACTDKKEEPKNPTTPNEKPTTPTEVKTERIIKELNGKKYSLLNTSCKVSADIATPNFNSDKTVTFKDISGSKYKASIERLARVDTEFNEPVVHGTTPSTYEPSRGITRAEFLAIVLQSHCIDVYKKATSTPFADLTVGDWKTNVVSAALERGIIAGDVRNGVKVFRPNDTISKIEALAILTKMKDLKVEGDYTHSYTDVAADWQNRVLNLVEYLELEPKSSKFNPNSTIARDAMANYIVKTAELY